MNKKAAMGMLVATFVFAKNGLAHQVEGAEVGFDLGKANPRRCNSGHDDQGFDRSFFSIPMSSSPAIVSRPCPLIVPPGLSFRTWIT